MTDTLAFPTTLSVNDPSGSHRHWPAQPTLADLTRLFREHGPQMASYRLAVESWTGLSYREDILHAMPGRTAPGSAQIATWLRDLDLSDPRDRIHFHTSTSVMTVTVESLTRLDVKAWF